MSIKINNVALQQERIKLTKSKKGGAGRGQGRKLKYSEPTKKLLLYAPLVHHNKIRTLVMEYLKPFIINNQNK